MKKEIIADIREHANLTQNEAEVALAAVGAAIRRVAEAGVARVPGLGSFKVKRREARTGRNPKTGEAVQIAARDALTFRESKGG
jgi:DNA-binding protein HU-beta